jgi:hypothetical protein
MTKLCDDNWISLKDAIKQQQYGLAPTKYKYKEDQIIADFHAYIDKTYGQHYMTEEQNIECFDVWLALGESMPTFRNTAIKYLWRYGKKHGSNKDDLLKVLHYVIMMLYVDHYKEVNEDYRRT